MADAETEISTVWVSRLAWLIDFEAYRKLGRSITGTCYVSDELGPSVEGDYPHGQDSRRRPIGTQPFNPDELAIIEAVVDRYGDWPIDELVDLSREHPGNRLVQVGDEVPYDSVFLPTEPPPDDAVELGRRLIREGNWGHTPA